MGLEEMKQLTLSGIFLMSMIDMWAADCINRTNQFSEWEKVLHVSLYQVNNQHKKGIYWRNKKGMGTVHNDFAWRVKNLVFDSSIFGELKIGHV